MKARAAWLFVIVLLANITLTRALAEVPMMVRQAMPAGAISLRWQSQPVSKTDAVWLHLYCKPAARSSEAAQTLGTEEKRSGPITRDEITQIPGIKSSPFWLEVWKPTSAQNWQRLSSARFVQDKDVNAIVVRWLEPKSKTGPILLLDFGFSHWYEWEVFTYAKGWRQTPAHQTFPWGGEGDFHVGQRFDQTRNGRTVVIEEEAQEDKISKQFYRWNGREWNDATQKYFLIGATKRTRAAAETWRAAKGWGEVVRSDDFSRLKAGYYLVVLERFRSLRDANQRAREVKKDSAIDAYVRRAMP